MSSKTSFLSTKPVFSYSLWFMNPDIIVLRLCKELTLWTYIHAFQESHHQKDQRKANVLLAPKVFDTLKVLPADQYKARFQVCGSNAEHNIEHWCQCVETLEDTYLKGMAEKETVSQC